MDRTLYKLNEIFKDVFDDNELTITSETSSDDIEDWDSLAQINLMAAVQEEFGISIGMGEISKITKVSDILDILNNN